MPAEDEPAAEAGEEEITAEDNEPRRTMPTPMLPTQADVDEHNIDHFPYRAWCDSCVCGRGQESAHHRVEPGKRRIAMVMFDYFFVTKKGMFTREEWNAGEGKDEKDFLKVLVVRESLNKCVFAHAVEQQGRR